MLSDRLLHRLLHLTGRERLLLAALGRICLPLGIAVGVILPLGEALVRAEREVAEARELLAWVEAEARRLPPTARGAAPVDATTPSGLAGIEQGLMAADLRQNIVELANRRAGEIEIVFAPTAFAALASWMESVERDAGYTISSLRIEAADRPGEVTAQVTLAPRS